MLLRDYLLLNLGRVAPAYEAAWRADMTARVRVYGSRDLLAASQTLEGEVRLTAILAPRRGLAGAKPLETGLREAAGRTLAHFPSGVALTAAAAAEEEGVLVGEAAFTATPPANHRAVANAFAFYFEEIFGYAQASQHPVAYEESMRPN